MKEWGIVIIMIAVVIAAGAVFLTRRRQSGGKPTVMAGPAPAAQDSLHQELMNRMEEFLNRDRFCLVIQPLVDFGTGAAGSGEVLSRLHLSERGVVFPDQFLPVVDALGLYPRFDRYIFRKSCAWLRRSMEEGEAFDFLSCNFSRKTLCEETIVQDLIRIADGYGIPHHKVGVEITEREREMDAGQLVKNLKQLKAAGFRIILDDYGNGVTSADELMQYPLDLVKIDRSILLNACTAQNNMQLREMVAGANRLGMDVVCEGIETEEEHRLAREAGCRYGQGFLFFKPMAQDQVFEMMHKGSILDDDL